MRKYLNDIPCNEAEIVSIHPTVKEDYIIDKASILNIGKIERNSFEKVLSVFWLCKSLSEKIFLLNTVYNIDNCNNEDIINELIDNYKSDPINNMILTSSNIPIYYSNLNFYNYSDNYNEIVVSSINNSDRIVNLYINKIEIFRSLAYVDSIIMSGTEYYKDKLTYYILRNLLENQSEINKIDDINRIYSVICNKSNNNDLLFGVYINEEEKLISASYSSLGICWDYKIPRKILNKFKSIYEEKASEINYCNLIFDIRINGTNYILIDTLNNDKNNTIFIMDIDKLILLSDKLDDLKDEIS